MIRARTRGQAKLREPSKTQAQDIAQPLARIAARHVPAELLNPDLADAIAAMNATGAYVSAGPLVVPRTDVDPGVPSDLQESQP